jgi:hypothetical protein
MRILGLVILVFAISVYQAVALVAAGAFLVWFLGTCVLQNNKGRSVWSLIFYGVQFGLWMFGAVVLHKGSAWVLRKMFTDGKGYSLVDGLYSGDLPRKNMAWLTSMKRYYGSGFWPMGWQTTALLVVATLAAVIVVLTIKQQRRASRLLGVAVLVALLATPFMLVILTGFDWPTRTMLAIPFTIAGMVWLGLGCSVQSVRYAIVVAALVCGWHYIESINRLMYADLLSWKQDQSIAMRLQERINNVRGVSGGQYRVVLIGGYTPPSIPAIRRTETIGASIFSWDGGNPYRVAALLKLMGANEIAGSELPEDMAHAVKASPSMPIWPDQGSVIEIDDLIVIKFGDLSYRQRSLLRKHGIDE